jgi:hypothetical protein
MRSSIEPKLLPAALLITLLALAGCQTLGLGDNFQCPSLTDNVTFQSYGGFSFGNVGDDSTARKIVSNCSWHVFDGHNGGTGETLEVASPNEEVVLVWAFNNFSAFRLTKGWTGKTDRGARLGDSATAFHNLYPEFTVVSPQLATFSSGGTNVEAHFDQANALEELLVGNFFRN